MTALHAVIFIIALSTIVSLFYLVLSFIKGQTEMKLNGLIMLVSPVVGPLYYFGQFIAVKLMRKDRSMQMEDIGFSKKRDLRVLNPDMEAEMEAVPLEETLLVSSAEEKRKQLLFELKKENIENYGTIIKALDNDDPETVHYAAAVITSVKTDFEKELYDMDNKYSKNVGEPNITRSYSNNVISFLDSDILEPMERKKYQYLLLNLLANVNNPDEFLTQEDYKRMVNAAIAVDNMQEAVKWANISLERYNTEASYINVLKAYYYTGRGEEFHNALQRLKSSDIALSEEGLEYVRFFSKPRN